MSDKDKDKDKIIFDLDTEMVDELNRLYPGSMKKEAKNDDARKRTENS